MFSGCADSHVIIPMLYDDGCRYRNYNITYDNLICGISELGITGGTYSGGYLYFSGAGVNFIVDVTALLDDTNTYVTGGTLNGETLVLSRNDGIDINIDLSALDFTGNTSATCISDLYVHNLGGCSPINLLTELYSESSITGSIFYGDGGSLTNINKITQNEFTIHTGETSIHYTKDAINLSDLGITSHTHNVSEIIGDIGGAFTGNTSATCISDLYVSNIHSCSPLNIYGDVYVTGDYLSDANYNSRFGTDAGNSLTTGTFNIAYGYNTLYLNTIGQYNVAIGVNAQQNNIGASQNIAIGTMALEQQRFDVLDFRGNPAAWDSNNIAIGHQSLAMTNSTATNNGINNVGIGTRTLYQNITGFNNVVMGHEAGLGNSTGSGNIFLGYQAGYNETGSNKLYIENSDSPTPLIYGDFSTKEVTINNKLYTQNLNISGLTTGTVINNLGIDINGDIIIGSNTYVTGGTLDGSILVLTRNDGVEITQDLSSISGGGAFTGNTSATCINDLYVHNLGGCSPINITTDINVSGNVNKTLAPYKIYTALLSQNAPIPSQTSGTFTIGQIWTVTSYVAGDDFSNMELISGTTQNETGAVIRATDTTPTVWINSSDLSYDGAPYVVSTDSNGNLAPFENTLGDVSFGYLEIGTFVIICIGNLISNKTLITTGGISNNGCIYVQAQEPPDSFTIESTNGAGDYTDSLFFDLPIEIRVYN